MKLVKNFLKGLFIVISVACIAFTAFFVLAAANGNTNRIDKVERGIFTLAHAGASAISGTSSDDASSVGLLTSHYGLSTSEAGQVLSLAGKLGVDTDDPDEVNRFVARNVGNADEIRDVAGMLQAGQITESEAKSMLMDIVNF